MYDEEATQQSHPAAGDTDEFEVALGPATILEEIRSAQFPLARRGYDREAVEAYIARVFQLVEDLEATRSPQGAVNRALQEVGEKTAGVLREAQQAAHQITSRSEAEATERLARAERDASSRMADAEVHVRRLDEDTDRIWAERHRLIADTRSLAEALLKLADDAEERFPGEQPEAADSGTPAASSDGNGRPTDG